VERCLPYQAVNSKERDEQLKCLTHAGIYAVICCVCSNDVEILQKQINIQYSQMTVFDWEVSCILCSCFTNLSTQPVLPAAPFTSHGLSADTTAHTLSMATPTMHIQELDQESGTLSWTINVILFKAVTRHSSEATKCSTNATMYIHV
jgi:hypothetical protein